MRSTAKFSVKYGFHAMSNLWTATTSRIMHSQNPACILLLTLLMIHGCSAEHNTHPISQSNTEEQNFIECTVDTENIRNGCPAGMFCTAQRHSTALFDGSRCQRKSRNTPQCFTASVT